MKRVCLSIVLLAAMAAAAGAQEFRGAITGRITDESGGALPGVTVIATNVATNVATTTTTGGEGDYNILYLTPGNYKVTAELSGFKKLLRDGIQVRIGDRVGLDLKMEIGRMEETVSVTAESPLLETRSGSAGQVIDEKQISLMPLSDGNPFALSRLVPGVAYTGDLKFSRPFDNGGTSSINADGSTGGNEFSLDGSPNMANGRRVAFVPPAGAVQEFKVSTASFDAAEGHTAGALVNVTLKSGTNRLSGEAYEYMRRDSVVVDRLLRQEGRKPRSRRSPTIAPDSRSAVLSSSPASTTATTGRSSSAPSNGSTTSSPSRARARCPSLAMRSGDFSELLAQNVHRSTIRPRPQRVGARVVRTPFPGNIIPTDRLSPIAQQLLKYFPTPNQAGTLGTQQLLLDATRGATLSIRFRRASIIGSATSSRRSCATRATTGANRATRTSATVNGIIPTGNFLYRINDGVTADHVYTMSSTIAARYRGSAGSASRSRTCASTKGWSIPATLGFTPSVDVALRGRAILPARSTSAASRRLATTCGLDHPQRLLVPADPHPHHGQPRDPRRATTCACTRNSASTRTGSAANTSSGANLHAAAGQLVGSVRPGVRELPARAADRRLDRSQRRTAQLHDVQRRVRAGRLEGLGTA